MIFFQQISLVDWRGEPYYQKNRYKTADPTNNIPDITCAPSWGGGVRGNRRSGSKADLKKSDSRSPIWTLDVYARAA
jgi:hypothetical protein